jgi:hypothetical protein
MAGLLSLASLTSPAGAQTEAYYQEMVVEGRIYVFSSEKKYQEYLASKDMGIAITRPGYGPNGETVIFEDAAAIEAFNKKYGMTEAPPKDVKTTDIKLPFGVVWRAPGLRFSFPKFELNWSNRVQLRFTQELPENDAGQAERSSFRIRRFKTKLDGWVYTKDLTYELQLNWPDTANPLEDANVDYDLTTGKRAFRIKAGQFKVPFGRQELTSSGSQQFVDRSAVSNEFARGRDIGVQLWGQFGREGVADLVEWRAGVFNGAGRTTSRNTNDAMQYNARVTVSPWGSTGYSESNLEAYPFRLSVAADYEDRDKIIRPATGAPSGDDRETFGTDISLKAAQILSVFVEYFDQDRTNPAGVTVPWDGLVGQVGVFVVPQKLEIAGRWAQLDPNGDVGNNEQIESGVAVNWFWNKHNHKIQLDYRQLENEATDVANDEFRLQYQLIF